MFIDEKFTKIPNFGGNINRWADFIELKCLIEPEYIVTVGDFLDYLTDIDIRELDSGSEKHAEKYDKLRMTVKDYYSYLKYREKEFEDFYPFTIENGDTIIRKEDLGIEHWNYVFLLLCSSIYFMEKSILYKYTQKFEEYCSEIMGSFMSKDFETLVFGTSKGDGVFKGNLKERFKILAEKIGTQITSSLDGSEKYNNIPHGDGGLDIFSYYHIDEATYTPFAFGQCTCSWDNWIEKQRDISREVWAKRIRNLAPYSQYMFVPFLCRKPNGMFEVPEDINTFLVDRLRIIIQVRNNVEIMEKIDVEAIVREDFVGWQ